MTGYLEAVRFNLHFYRELAEKAIAQIDDAQLHWKPDEQANNVAILMQHLAGNFVSRWTDFLTSDGEKPTRDRDGEFIDADLPRADLMRQWQEGWAVLDGAIEALSEADLDRTVTIRGKSHSALEAIERAVAHIAYHVGQITYIARMLKGAEQWQTLSIARNASRGYGPSGQR